MPTHDDAPLVIEAGRVGDCFPGDVTDTVAPHGAPRPDDRAECPAECPAPHSARPIANKYQWLDALARSSAPPGAEHWPAATVRAVGLAITTWMDPAVGVGYCSASVPSIAARAGCSDRQVRRVLAALEGASCITRTASVGGDPRHTCVIRLRADAFGWPPATDTPDCGAAPPHSQSATPDCGAGDRARARSADSQSDTPDCESATPDCGAGDYHLYHHPEDRQKDHRHTDPVESSISVGERDAETVGRSVGPSDASTTTTQTLWEMLGPRREPVDTVDTVGGYPIPTVCPDFAADEHGREPLPLAGRWEHVDDFGPVWALEHGDGPQSSLAAIGPKYRAQVLWMWSRWTAEEIGQALQATVRAVPGTPWSYFHKCLEAIASGDWNTSVDGRRYVPSGGAAYLAELHAGVGEPTPGLDEHLAVTASVVDADAPRAAACEARVRVASERDADADDDRREREAIQAIEREAEAAHAARVAP